MVERVASVEGDPVLLLYRYAGHGPVIRYRRSSGQWDRIEGSMTLELTPLTSSFDPAEVSLATHYMGTSQQ